MKPSLDSRMINAFRNSEVESDVKKDLAMSRITNGKSITQLDLIYQLITSKKKVKTCYHFQMLCTTN